MKVKKGQTVQLKITELAFGGKGLARLNGLAVFVDQAVPLDIVNARIVKKKKNYAEARILEMLEYSPYRVEPECEYSGFCGGCKWQFLEYEKQLEYKRMHVAESLEHIGLIKGVPVHPVIPSPLVFAYRNKMEFSCSERRWLLPHEMEKEGIDRGLALGLHVPGTYNKVLDINKCLLMPDLGNRILGDIRSFIKNSGVPVYGFKTHEGYWRFVMLRHSTVYDTWMINIITSKEERKTVQPLADYLTDTYPEIISVVNNITSRKAGIAIGEYEVPLAGERSIKDGIGGLEFEISSNSFFQTNTKGAEILYETVKKYADLSKEERVMDLYSGTGTIAASLSDSAKEIIGIEIVESAVNDAEKNCRRNGISNCRFVLGDIRECLSEISERIDVMVIDPPRSGMHKDVVKQVSVMAPERIVYVSCNPATMARDLNMLKEQYAVLEIQPVDMFPHTYHIEAVARLNIKNQV